MPPLPSDSDASITHFFQELRAGNRSAADRLWEHYCPRLLGLARKTLGHRGRRGADAEDAAQSAFISFWQRAERGDFLGDLHRDNLWNLLGLITVRKALKQLERQNAQKRGGGKVLNEASLAAANEGQGFRLEDALGNLSAPDFDLFCQDLLLLLDEETRSIALLRLMGYKNREIAESLDCTERKVERKLQLTRLVWEQELKP